MFDAILNTIPYPRGGGRELKTLVVYQIKSK